MRIATFADIDCAIRSRRTGVLILVDYLEGRINGWILKEFLTSNYRNAGLFKKSRDVLRRTANNSAIVANNDRSLQQNRMPGDRGVDVVTGHVRTVKTRFAIFSFVDTDNFSHRTAEHLVQLRHLFDRRRLFQIFDYVDRLATGLMHRVDECICGARF